MFFVWFVCFVLGGIIALVRGRKAALGFVLFFRGGDESRTLLSIGSLCT